MRFEESILGIITTAFLLQTHSTCEPPEVLRLPSFEVFFLPCTARIEQPSKERQYQYVSIKRLLTLGSMNNGTPKSTAFLLMT